MRIMEYMLDTCISTLLKYVHRVRCFMFEYDQYRCLCLRPTKEAQNEVGRHATEDDRNKHCQDVRVERREVEIPIVEE